MLKYLNKQKILKRIDNNEMKANIKIHTHCQVARKAIAQTMEFVKRDCTESLWLLGIDYQKQD